MPLGIALPSDHGAVRVLIHEQSLWRSLAGLAALPSYEAEAAVSLTRIRKELFLSPSLSDPRRSAFFLTQGYLTYENAHPRTLL